MRINMKFRVTINDVVKNDYLSILERLSYCGEVKAYIENEKVILVYQGIEVVRPFIFPEKDLLIEDKIEMMSKFIGVLIDGIFELKKRYEQITEEFDAKMDKKIEVMNDLHELPERYKSLDLCMNGKKLKI